MSNIKHISNFIFEIETLKSIKRSGSSIARVPNPDSIAEHIAIASQVAYILARLEGANAQHCACMMLFHDNAEVRIGDINKVNARYIDSKKSEMKAHKEQIEKLPTGGLQEELHGFFIEYSEQKSLEAKVCKDADLLELAFQSKIFLEQGFHAKKNWLENIEKSLKTSSAKAIFQSLLKSSSSDWWEGLKKIKV